MERAARSQTKTRTRALNRMLACKPFSVRSDCEGRNLMEMQTDDFFPNMAYYLQNISRFDWIVPF